MTVLDFLEKTATECGGNYLICTQEPEAVILVPQVWE